MPASGAPPSGAPPPQPPRALRSLADGVVLAHRRFLQLYPLALLVDGSLELAITLWTGGGPGGLVRWLTVESSRAPRLTSLQNVLLGALVALDTFLPALVTTAFVARSTHELARRRPARAWTSLAAGARRLPVAIATAVAFSIVPTAAAWFVTGGPVLHPVVLQPLVVLFALLLTAAILARFALATPAAVLERRGLIGAWRRSERLVDGSMWRVIGLVVLAGLSWAFLSSIVDTAAQELARQALPGYDVRAAPALIAIAFAFARSAVEAWFHLIVGVVTTLLFERMRRVKEGPDADELQQVFA